MRIRILRVVSHHGGTLTLVDKAGVEYQAFRHLVPNEDAGEGDVCTACIARDGRILILERRQP